MGMISDSQSPQGMSAPQAPTKAPPSAGGNVPEDEWVDRVVVAAGEALYSEKQGGVAESIARGDAPTATANVTVALVASIDDQLGGQIPEEDVLPAAAQVLELVIELREATTGSKLSEQEVQQANLAMVQGLAEEYGTAPEQMQEFLGEFDQADIDTATQMFGGPPNG